MTTPSGYIYPSLRERLQAVRDAEHDFVVGSDRISPRTAEENLDAAMMMLSAELDTELPLSALCGAVELLDELGLELNIASYSEGELATIRDALTKAGVL